MSEQGESGDAAQRPSLARLFLLPLRLVLRAALRAAVSSVVFVVCACVMMRLLGYDLPDAADMEKYLKGIGQLADVLS
jgi:hypothetical protein